MCAVTFISNWASGVASGYAGYVCANEPSPSQLGATPERHHYFFNDAALYKRCIAVPN